MNASVRSTVNWLLSVRKRCWDTQPGNAKGQDLRNRLAALLGTHVLRLDLVELDGVHWSAIKVNLTIDSESANRV